MDQRILFVALGVAAIAFAGLAFAGGYGWNSDGMQPGGWNGTFKPQGMMRGQEGAGFGMMRGWAGNGTCAQAGNLTGMPRFNSTEQQAFEAAVESGDFVAAAKLHEEYGFGGQMFEKLNATTFAKFSQMHRLRSELMGELGVDGGQGMMAGRPGFGAQGIGSRGIMGNGFAKGMRHGFSQETNQTAQQ